MIISTDEYGISPLMYASWNGHVDCVKVLSDKVNTRGVTKLGKKTCALRLVTMKGYNALHLAAISMADPPNVTEVVLVLLQAGINFTTLDKNGKTAYELAVESCNAAFVEAYDSIIDTIPIDPSWNDPEEDSNVIRNSPPMSRETKLRIKLEEMKKLVYKNPSRNLPILQGFQSECKINLDRRSVFKNNTKDDNNG